MGHDIFGKNKEGEQISYLRFGTSNHWSYDFYELFNAIECHGGVSGTGQVESYKITDVERALKAYQTIYEEEINSPLENENEFDVYDREQILVFIQSCLKTVREEGVVRILYS